MYIVYTDRHRQHAPQAVRFEGYPFITEEVPARVENILNATQAVQLGTVVGPADHGIEPILAVHDEGYIDFLRTIYTEHAAYFQTSEPVFTWTFATRHNGRKPKSFLGLMGYYASGWGTPIVEGTWEAAYWGAQCALSAADLVWNGERVTYALCRPPGHHASADLYGGFCYLNNAAIAARRLEAAGARVAILDIDYHHGNGTQAIFYADPNVLFCSLHAHPDDDYPYYWGEVDERGVGPGQGFNHNWPLPQGADDATYLLALDEVLAVIRVFEPNYLVVSAGFDIVAGDPVGGFCISADGLREIGRRIAGLNLPTVIVQEGGYLLERLGEDAVTFLQAFV